MGMFSVGSFTKNIGSAGGREEKVYSGLEKLRENINLGFQNQVSNVQRETFRERSNLTKDNVLIPLNYFLINQIIEGKDTVLCDELVAHSITNSNISQFNALALFALNIGLNGTWKSAGITTQNETWMSYFVRNHLWQNGKWQSQMLSNESMNSYLKRVIPEAEEKSLEKIRNNYRFFFELVFNCSKDTITTNYQEWLGPAIFLLCDRLVYINSIHSIDYKNLIKLVNNFQLYKFLGCNENDFDPTEYVYQYCASGGLSRLVSVKFIEDIPVIQQDDSKVEKPKKVDKVVPKSKLSFNDLQIRTKPVETLLRNYHQQIRDRSLAAYIKEIYEHKCMFCGEQIISSLNPTTYYSEAAHIKPIGMGGYDSKDNIIVLCPKHHIQFDRGLISMEELNTGEIAIITHMDGDPTLFDNLKKHKDHELNFEFIVWHKQNLFD